MEINLDKLLAVAKDYKVDSSGANLPAYEVWIPAPSKDEAKQLGVRWNPDTMRHEVKTSNFESHPAYKFSPQNFVKLKANIQMKYKKEFKEAGVVSRKNEQGEWEDFILNHEDYAAVMEVLVEIELL